MHCMDHGSLLDISTSCMILKGSDNWACMYMYAW